MATITDPEEREQQSLNQEIQNGKNIYNKGKNIADKVKNSRSGGSKNKDGKKDKDGDKNKNKKDKNKENGSGKKDKNKTGGKNDTGNATKGAGDAVKKAENPAKKAAEAAEMATDVARAAAADPSAIAKLGGKAIKAIGGAGKKGKEAMMKAMKDSSSGGSDPLVTILAGVIAVLLIIVIYFVLSMFPLICLVFKFGSFFANLLHLDGAGSYDEMTEEEQYEYIANIIHDHVRASYDDMIEEWQNDINTLAENPQYNEFGIAFFKKYNENEDAATVQKIIDENENNPSKPLRFGSGHDDETIDKSTSDWALSVIEYRGIDYYPVGMKNLMNEKDDDGRAYDDGSAYYPVGNRYRTTKMNNVAADTTDTGAGRDGYYKGHQTGKNDDGSYKGNYLKGDEPLVDSVKSKGSMDDQSNNGAVSDMAYLVAAYGVSRCDMPISESNSWIASTFKSYRWDIAQGTFWKDLGSYIGVYSYFNYEAAAETVPAKSQEVTVKDSSGSEISAASLEYSENKKTIVSTTGSAPATAETANGDPIDLNDIYLEGGKAYAHGRTVLEYKECLWLDTVVKKTYKYSLVSTAEAIDSTVDRTGLDAPLYAQEKGLETKTNDFDVQTADLSAKTISTPGDGYYLNRDFDGHKITDTYEDYKIQITGKAWDNFIPKYSGYAGHDLDTIYINDSFYGTKNIQHTSDMCVLPSNVPVFYNVTNGTNAESKVTSDGSKVEDIHWETDDKAKLILSDMRFTAIPGSTKSINEYKVNECIGKDYKGNNLNGYIEGDIIWGYTGVKKTSNTKTVTMNGYFSSIPPGYTDIQNKTADNPYKITAIGSYTTTQESEIAITSADVADATANTTNRTAWAYLGMVENNPTGKAYYYYNLQNGKTIDTVTITAKTGETDATKNTTVTRIEVYYPSSSYNVSNLSSVEISGSKYYLTYGATAFDDEGNGIDWRPVLLQEIKDDKGIITGYQTHTFTNLYVKPRYISATNFTADIYQHTYQKYEKKDYGIKLTFTVSHPSSDADYDSGAFVKSEEKKSFNHSTYKYEKYPYAYTYLKSSSDLFDGNAFVEVMFEAGGWYDENLYEYSTRGYYDEDNNLHTPARNQPIDTIYPGAPKDSDGNSYLEAEWSTEYGIQKFPYRRSITMFQYACDEDVDKCAMGTESTCKSSDDFNTLVVKRQDSKNGHWEDFNGCGCGAEAIKENNYESKYTKSDAARTQVIQSPYSETRIVKEQGAKEMENKTKVITVSEAIDEKLKHIKDTLDNYEEVQSDASNGETAATAAVGTYEGGTDLVNYAIGIIMANEGKGGYTNINPCDPDGVNGDPTHGSVSIGKIQYNADGARDMIKNIMEKDKDSAQRIWKKYSKYEENKNNMFYTVEPSSWEHASPPKHTVCKHKPDIDYTSFEKCLKELLSSKAGKEAQDKAISGRVQKYIDDINGKWHIEDPAALVWLADIENQYGWGGIQSTFGSMIDNAIKASGGSGNDGSKVTLKHLWKAFTSGGAGKQFITRRKNTYNKLITDQKSGRMPKTKDAKNGAGYGEGDGSGGGTQLSFPGGATSIKVTYYNQADGWGAYGGSTMKKSGCCPSSLAIVLATYGKQVNGSTPTPSNVGAWCSSNGYYVLHQGTMHQCVPAALKHFGVNTTQPKNKQDVINAISAGKLVVCCMGPGTFTSGGHFMCLAGITKAGTILVADCGSRQRTGNKAGYSLDLIWSQVKKCHGVVDMWIAER